MKLLIILSLLATNTLFGQDSLTLNYNSAKALAEVPLACIDQVYPNKLSQVLNSDNDLKSPLDLHPIFFGCFDWHSSVHGHWLLTKFLNDYPNSEMSETISNLWDDRFSTIKVLKEARYFSIENNTSFERTYGWAWLLKLQSQLKLIKHPNAQYWDAALQPLSNLIVSKYKTFLPKLAYPIRVGEHTNTAFGLSFALDYAKQVNDTILIDLIVSRSKDFFINDKAAPILWEPSGFDFLSPSLEEANLMSNVLTEKEFSVWIKGFLPGILKKDFTLSPATVNDRTDGKLVHLDGLNFSRAWCLYRLAHHLPSQKDNLISIADAHIQASMNEVTGSHYMGSHWLASFLVYALEMRGEIIN